LLVEGPRPGAAGVELEQAAGLGGGLEDQVAAGFICYEGWRGICSRRGEYLPTAFRPPFLPGRPGGGEERVREHGQGEVPVPGAVAADLVMVQAGLVLGLGEDSPGVTPLATRLWFSRLRSSEADRDDVSDRDRCGATIWCGVSPACRVVELGHQLSVGGPCCGEVLVALLELQAQAGGLLLEMGDLLGEAV
jgi:hypothetical protein